MANNVSHLPLDVNPDFIKVYLPNITAIIASTTAARERCGRSAVGRRNAVPILVRGGRAASSAVVCVWRTRRKNLVAFRVLGHRSLEVVPFAGVVVAHLCRTDIVVDTFFVCVWRRSTIYITKRTILVTELDSSGRLFHLFSFNFRFNKYLKKCRYLN